MAAGIPKVSNYRRQRTKNNHRPWEESYSCSGGGLLLKYYKVHSPELHSRMYVLCAIRRQAGHVAHKRVAPVAEIKGVGCLVECRGGRETIAFPIRTYVGGNVFSSALRFSVPPLARRHQRCTYNV